MVNAKQIKNQIKSTGNIKQITKALEVVATVKLQKNKHQTEWYKQFMIEFLKIVQVVNTTEKLFNNKQIDENKEKKELIIVIGTDRWLCGWLNNRLFKHIFTKHEDNKQTIEVFTIWKKALEFFTRTNFDIAGQMSLKDTFNGDDLRDLYVFIRNAIETKKYKWIRLYFNYFNNAIKQTPIDLQLFPLQKKEYEKFAEQIDIDINDFITDQISKKDILLEPSKNILAKEVKEQLIQHVIYWAILQNKTGEYAARMIAMKNAKDNSTTMIKALKLSYNKARQAAVTQEVSEIMSAKMALEK
jgi:F-type H+-transporting ATPase subunit gamma